jgi:hypothetical protein
MITVYNMLDSELQRSNVFFNMDTFSNLDTYLEIAVPGALMISFEWWAFEILTLMAGYMIYNPNDPTSSPGIICQAV